MDLQLTDRTALVTGSTAGIGHAIATSLAREGARVVLNGRTQERIDAARDAILNEHPDADLDGVAADLATAEGAQKTIEAVPKVDILVNNVGIFDQKPFAEIPDEDWMRFFETNVMSGVRLARHYFPQMLDSGFGRIVFISSESGLRIPEEMIHYGMTKSAQISIARGLAELTQGTGGDVTVNSVLPGPTWSEGLREAVEAMAEAEGLSLDEAEQQFFETERPTSLLRRFIQPAEVGNFVAYVCSPLASATTGAALRVEGGVVQSI